MGRRVGDSKLIEIFLPEGSSHDICLIINVNIDIHGSWKWIDCWDTVLYGSHVFSHLGKDDLSKVDCIADRHGGQ